MYSFNRKLNENEMASLNRMNKLLFHRGPDECDSYLSERACFGFCYLKTIGLSNGLQPIISEDSRYVLVCDGVIFNYLDLKTELIEMGHHFRTDSNAEVILHLYEESGLQLLDKISGQFSFSLYDSLEHKLIVARDHFGITPLFYSLINGVFVFASEIKAILEYPGADRTVDLVGLDQCFSLPGIVSPRTIFKSISSVKPGHYITVDQSGISEVEYWDISYPKDQAINYHDESYYLEKIRDLLNQSIRRRMISDVPVGAYLSGGLDSSLISKLANGMHKGLHSVYSMTFRDKFFDEEAFQEIMRKDIDIQGHSYLFDLEDVYKNMSRVIWHSETPLKESYNTTSIILSNLVRGNGVKVVLTGEGADELFAGYPSYKFDYFRYESGSNMECSIKESEYRNKLWGRADFLYEKNYTEFDEIKKSIFSRDITENYNEINFVNFGLVNKKRLQGIHPLHVRSYIDFKVRVADHLISDHGDRMLMANSVEGRYPFLDKDLVEFVTRIPPNLKLNNYEEKYILKKLSDKVLPGAIINREKFGFSAPGSPQLLQNKSEWVQDYLSYNKIKKDGYFNPDTIEELRIRYSTRGFLLNIPYEEDLLMPVITFGILKEMFNIPNYNDAI